MRSTGASDMRRRSAMLHHIDDRSGLLEPAARQRRRFGSEHGRTPIKASAPPIRYMMRQPYSKPGPAMANGRPMGNGVAGVVNHRPSQMPSTAPSAEKRKMSAV